MIPLFIFGVALGAFVAILLSGKFEYTYEKVSNKFIRDFSKLAFWKK